MFGYGTETEWTDVSDQAGCQKKVIFKQNKRDKDDWAHRIDENWTDPNLIGVKNAPNATGR